MAALREYKIRSPLAECGITKAGSGNSPAATAFRRRTSLRIPALRPGPGRTYYTNELLARIERAEEKLLTWGFLISECGVLGDSARLQLPKPSCQKAFEMRGQVKEALRDEFSSVLLDLTAR
jgi:PP-loop superfamily ATP-utilizing enzyme